MFEVKGNAKPLSNQHLFIYLFILKSLPLSFSSTSVFRFYCFAFVSSKSKTFFNDIPFYL